MNGPGLKGIAVYAMAAVFAAGGAVSGRAQSPTRQNAASPTAREAVRLAGPWGAAPKEWGESNVVWRAFRAEVPESWRGRRVFVEIPGPLHKCDAVVFVNGERAGDILRPGLGGVEATHLVKFGGENGIRFLLTESGAGTARGETRAVTQLHHAKKGPAGDNPRLAAYPETFIGDVFANTSWRRKRCDFEVEIDGGGNLTQRRGEAEHAEMSIAVFDAASNVVWRGGQELSLTNGINKAVVPMPWDEGIVPWELGRPALYTAVVSLATGDEVALRFGFREVWREGRHIFMNGHRAHFRVVYGFGARSAPGLGFLQSIGYNVLFRGHSREAVGILGEEMLSGHDECGMGIYGNVGAYDILGADLLNKDPAMREEFRRFVRAYHRCVRNHPSILAGILGTMSKTNQGFGPAAIGMPREKPSDRAEQIELARDLHREANPNILYLSHADGPVADLDSGNVYLNWTPIHEQESWLETWARTGEYPWSSIEFLAPYPGDFVKQGVFLGTEFLASLYGDRAFREETDDFLARMGEADAAAKGHGSPVGNEMLRGMPLYWDLRRDWTWRLNSRWRAFGLNGGNMWFNLSEAYGMPPEFTGKSHLARYGAITNEIAGRPAWANEGYDIHQLGNKDFCGFIGGAPDFADRTHAFFPGERIEKQLVLLWDGVGEKRIEAEWRLSAVEGDRMPSTAIEGGHASVAIPQGERAFTPISFTAPEVSAPTRFRLAATFTGEGVEPFTDTFDFEIWPVENDGCMMSDDELRMRDAERRLALLDPLGTAAPVLDALGIAYARIASVAELPAGATHLVVGRDALEKHRLDALAPRVEAGLRLLVMRQTPETWKRLGFRVQDLMAREVFPRDKAFAALPQEALREWRGTPDYPNAPYGRVMGHATQRGPRGTRRHTVAGLMLQTPERPGYLPLIVGGFDLNYSALLRFVPEGAGDITYCTLDFEGRVGGDPAATETAKAVFGEFMGLFTNGNCCNCSQITNANSTLQLQLGTPANPVNSVNPVSKDLCASAPLRENYSLVACDEARAKAEGFAIGDETTVFRAAIPDNPAFRGVGPGDARWPTGLRIRPLRGEGATPDGAFAIRRLADGRILVFSQVPEGQLAARAAARPETEARLANAERLDEGRVRRLYARLRTNCRERAAEPPPPSIGGSGDSPSLALRRALHQAGSASFEPLPALHLLGPFAAGKDDGRLMLDTVWSELGERMAIDGDFDPNQEIPLPQGGTANWRPMLAPTSEGVYDFAAAQPVASFPVTYAQCVVERRVAGEAILKLGGDWRFRVWCNGEEVFRSERGARIPRFEVKLNLKAGENILAFKVGAGSSGHKLIALLATESENGENSDTDPELDAMTLYEDDVQGFDPYEFHFW